MESHLEIEVSSRPVGRTHLVDVDGEVDLYTGPLVRNCVQGLIDQGHYSLIVDLQDERYIDSTGLGIFMEALGQIQEKNGRIVILCANDRVLRIFRLIGLLERFSIYATEEEAVASFG